VSRRLPALLLGAGLALAGCQMPASSPAPSAAGSASEAEKTRKMEEKAAEIERKAAEIQTMTGSDQEKMDAVNELEKERRELQAMSEERGPQ
jgi:hypothetical protein